MNFINSMVMMLGFSGASDYISLENMRARIETRIQNTLHYHNAIDLEFVNNVRAGTIDYTDQISTYYGIPVENVPSILKSLKQELTLGCASKSIELPSELRDCQNIFQLRAFTQEDGNSCGFWSIFNARALQNIIDRTPEPTAILPDNNAQYLLSSNNIQKRAVRDKHLIRSVFLEPDNLVNWAQRDNFNNFHVLIRPIDNGVPTIWLQTYYSLLEQRVLEMGAAIEEDIVNRDEQLREEHGENYHSAINELRAQANSDNITNQVKNQMDMSLAVLATQFGNNHVTPNVPGALHFACNLSFNNRGIHWILISIVKLTDRNPVMIILDSANFALGSQAQAFARYLYNLFVRPFEPQDLQD